MAPVPTTVTATAPAYSCPSAPIFQNFARKAIPAASPVRIYGVARAPVSAIEFLDPKAPLIK